ncbi:MAG TPA: zinc-binding alcohol dehydrogenase [Spirochaetia bacterium]|nr:zinc-binding alcohol dehydrogenase [Spirochaetia bacterium]
MSENRVKVAQVVFTGENRAELVPLAERADLAPREMRLETVYSLISPGTELSWYTGVQRDVAGSKFHYPVLPGYCNVAQVTEVGADITGFSPGDLVVSGAAHLSEFVLDPAPVLEFVHGDLRKPIAAYPTASPSELAPFAKMVEIALTAERVAQCSLGDHVVVIGQGMIGNLAAQLLQLSGAEVLVVDTSENRLEVSRNCGIAHTANPQTDALVPFIDEWTGGRGVDVTVESIGSARLIFESVEYTRKRGRIIMLGTPRRRMDMNPVPALWQAHMKGIEITGALRSQFYPLYPASFERRSVLDDLLLAISLIESGRINVRPFLTGRYKPASCQEAYQHLITAADRAMGVLFDWHTE